MRASSYNIIVKVDPEKKLYAILNGYTYAFGIINKDTHDYLLRDGNLQNVSAETKDTLVKKGYLTSLSKTEEMELVKSLSNKVHADLKLKKYGFHFILSYDCNLRCIYCYEDKVLNGCNSISKNKITKEQVDCAFEIIAEKDKGNIGHKIISLYGGEPF